MQEVVKLADVAAVVENTADVSETIADESTKISHNDLTDRNIADQHIIGSITGLQAELDKINALQNIESKSRGVAQYYAWAGGAPSEDMTGCFVSIVDEVDSEAKDTIKICASKYEDVFGVVVPASTTGLVGGVLEAMVDGKITEIDPQYALVCSAGKVLVRRESDVKVGDRVVPNVLGIARKSVVKNPIQKAHHDIIDIKTDATVYSLTYAPIGTPDVYILNSDGSIGEKISVTDEATGKTVALDGAQITVAIGDDGYSNGDQLCFMYKYESNGDVGYRVTAISYVNGVSYASIDLSANSSSLVRLQDEVNDLHSRITVVEENVVTAINKANEAYDKVENATSGGGSGGGNGSDSGTGGSGGTGGDVVIDPELEERVTELETKAEDLSEEMWEAQSKIEANTTNIEQTDQLIQTLVNTVHQYAVGEYSQAHGLTNEQAASMLSDDPATVYVPYTKDGSTITEEYYVEGASNVTKVFTNGYSYKWLGTAWDDGVQNVYIINEYVAGAEGNYWLIPGNSDITEGEIIYKAGTLYLYTNGAWTSVARLEDNALSRVGSMITQTADSIKASVVSQDAFATLQTQVEQNSADISLLSGVGGDYGTSLAGVQVQADKNSASVLQLSEYGDNVVGYNVLSVEPTGTFYAKRPEWSWSANKWVFSGNTNNKVGIVNEVNYCYAQNTNATFFYYTCENDNRWTRTEIGQSTAMAAIYQQSNEQGAMIDLVVKDGKINSAEIILAATKDGSSMDLIADNIGLSGYVTFTALSTSGMTTIHGGSIKTGTINVGAIAAGAITADKIAAKAITADKIDAGAIQADNISANAITADKIAAKAITADKIDAGAITAEHMTADSIEAIAAKVETATIDTIVSSNYVQDESGLKITLTDGVFDAKNFKIDTNGNVKMAGYITATGGWIGSETNGLQIKNNAIRNVRDVSDLAAAHSGSILDLYMTSYNEFSNPSSLWDFYIKDQNNGNAPINRDYIYVGTSGIGTYHINETSGGSITSAYQTWMANGELFSNSATITGNITATSGYIGNGVSGFTIGYSEKSKNYALMYNQNIYNGSSNLNAEGVYVGIDGIGLGNGRFYIDKSGNVHMRTGTIGYGDYQWTIFGDQNKAGLYYGNTTLAGAAGLGSSVTDCYIGTNGISCSNSGAHDYATVIKSGSVLTYGDTKATATTSNYNRATQVWPDGIRFFHAGSSKISDMTSLLSYKVGGIEIDIDKTIKIDATNGLKINGTSTLTGWVFVATSISAFSNMLEGRYLHFVNGLLVEIQDTLPSDSTLL